MAITPSLEKRIDAVASALKEQLGANLHALILYGSAVRGGFVEGRSDINLLIVVEASTPEAHAAIATSIRGTPGLAPFVLGRSGMERSLDLFAVKFRSIGRHYKVLHGADVFATWLPNAAVMRIVCEQALRNLRLRMKRSFILFGENRARFTEHLRRSSPALVTAVSDALRCSGEELPDDHAARVPILEQTFGPHVAVLRELAALRHATKPVTAAEAMALHSGVHALLTAVIEWIEQRWPWPPTV